MAAGYAVEASGTEEWSDGVTTWEKNSTTTWLPGGTGQLSSSFVQYIFLGMAIFTFVMGVRAFYEAN